MKLIILVALSAALLAAVHGGLPEGKNVKTSVKQLTWLEKMLIRKFHPKVDLDQITALEAKRDGKNTIQDEYVGYLEAFHVEVPLLLLQLVKMGADIQLPTFHYEYVWWFCIWGYCDGYMDIYDITNARLKTVDTTNVRASMSGTKFQVEFQIPDLEIECPECIYDYTDFGQDPPATSDRVYWRGYSLWVKNYSMIMTIDLRWNFNRIDITSLDMAWSMDQFTERQWNATHTFPDGTTEEWGNVDELHHETMLENWNDGAKENVEESVKYWLNCYLSNGRNNKGECGQYFDEPLHNITAAEIIHGFGLAALNNYRAAQKDLSSEINTNADDPMETISSILFEFATHVMQTGKYAAAWEFEPFPLQRAFTWVLNKEICSEDSHGNPDACETFQEQITFGAPPTADYEYTTEIYGATSNRAFFTFDTSTISYSFHVPDLTLNSRDFQRILTNVNTGDQQIFSALILRVANCTVGFDADYVFDEEAGQFAISNSKIELLTGEITMEIDNVNAIENGEWIELPPISKNAASMVMQLWQEKDQDGVSLQEKYQTFVEEKINDFLAGRITL